MKHKMLGLIVTALITGWTATAWSQSNLTVVRHDDNTLWAMTCDGISSCSPWTQITGKFSVQPTLTWDQKLNKYILIGIGSNQTSIWRSTFNADGSFNNDWTKIDGFSPSPVALAGGGSITGAKSMGLTTSGSANVMSVDLGMNEGAGVQIRYTVVATDGVNSFAMETGTIMFLAFTFTPTNKGMRCSMSPDRVVHGDSPNTWCSMNWFGGRQGFAITDNLLFTPVVHEVYFEISNLSRSPVILEP